VDRILVVGAESVAGGNLAAFQAESAPPAAVLAISRVGGISIPGCEVRCEPRDAVQPAALIREWRPARVIVCGQAAVSSWEPASEQVGTADVEEAAAWASACRAGGAQCTYVSSDAVFSGPWMFHDEECSGRCELPAAAALRQAERRVQEADPDSLILRTHVYGWSPRGDSGWIEQRLAELRSKRFADQDCERHATPILATDFARILHRAWTAGRTGVFHLAGAERISPLRFVQRLAEQYQLPWLSLLRRDALQERSTGFGAGECSLQTKRLRKALCVAMPMLSEGLARLAQQDVSGYRARLCGGAAARSRAA
jgi:dTDP-4-dehydrorhamnose reductase